MLPPGAGLIPTHHFGRLQLRFHTVFAIDLHHLWAPVPNSITRACDRLGKLFLCAAHSQAKTALIPDPFQQCELRLTNAVRGWAAPSAALLENWCRMRCIEREVIGERIRDKFAASRARGMCMGGKTPLGYDVRDRKLVVNEAEAATVRRVFHSFIEIGSGTKLTKMLRAEGVTTKRGKPINKGDIYKLLNSRTYVGEAAHKGQIHPGEHQGIISRDLWEPVHAILAESPRARANKNRAQSAALLRGLIFGADGRAMSPTHTRRRGRLYRYYVSQSVLKGTGDSGSSDVIRRVSAGEIEAAVVGQVRALFGQPGDHGRNLDGGPRGSARPDRE